MTDKELALEQALLAILAAAKESKIEIDDLVKKANSVILNSAHPQNIVDDKVIRTAACDEIQSATSKI
ncbi:hypothetical protein ACTUTK_07065 [Pantoea ananatis]|uniref:hypothetical protein n=1 Tax=Pantoea ananas TaxID=553 RepID=UPI003FA490D6